jgi:hypothetical protein
MVVSPTSLLASSSLAQWRNTVLADGRWLYAVPANRSLLARAIGGRRPLVEPQDICHISASRRELAAPADARPSRPPGAANSHSAFSASVGSALPTLVGRLECYVNDRMRLTLLDTAAWPLPVVVMMAKRCRRQLCRYDKRSIERVAITRTLLTITAGACRAGSLRETGQTRSDTERQIVPTPRTQTVSLWQLPIPRALWPFVTRGEPKPCGEDANTALAPCRSSPGNTAAQFVLAHQSLHRGPADTAACRHSAQAHRGGGS